MKGYSVICPYCICLNTRNYYMIVLPKSTICDYCKKRFKVVKAVKGLPIKKEKKK